MSRETTRTVALVVIALLVLGVLAGALLSGDPAPEPVDRPGSINVLARTTLLGPSGGAR